MTENLLEINNIKKYFPVKSSMFTQRKGYVRAVDGVTLSIKKGETLGLVGESGCGKSTLSRVILRLIEPDEGEILLEGQNILNLSGKKLRDVRSQMQMIFQNPFGSLNPRMTVGEIVRSPFDIQNVLTYQERMEKVKELLGLVGLSPKDANRYPHEFSGGQRQRIVIARAIALNPKLIICDEPVSALDVSIQSQILNLLVDLQQEFGLTYLFISHNLSVVQYVSDVIAVMYLGKIVEIADAYELYEFPKHPYTQALLSAIPVIASEGKKQRIILSGDVPTPLNPPEGCRFRTRCWRATNICKEKEPQLTSPDGNHLVACHLYNS
ncbi:MULTISPECIES: dipeptide ABC transporter ATP-binding protein [Tepidanaerobacter]|uniref:ABC transporter ATP-binding protein n=1 Tax=Tepidanaerobacter TaxID=499228 RepID=UPI000A5F4DF9|nr:MULTISPECIES: dipeptide ABC transporter ATP-binding protein [Tepidanaerobacter]GLI51122.1 oligopeptide transport ATP-binding protein AppF [Tepidanaerobacter syntrophicus]HHV82938.1 dipeptide ABC transporter ATP-binding protein [Tepidanaerobacter syntrophicus]